MTGLDTPSGAHSPSGTASPDWGMERVQTVTTIRLTPEHAGFIAEIERGPGFDVTALLIGRPVVEAAQVLPRLFNLCRMAQATAANLALGLPAPGSAADLGHEVLRDHMLKLFVVWPQQLGLQPRAFSQPDQIAAALFGPQAQMPDTMAAFWRWCDGDAGTAPLVRAVRDSFAPGEAIADLAMVTPATLMATQPLENSPACRHPGHAILDGLATSHGRGPLWRVVARLVDAAACLGGTLPPPTLLPNGTAMTPAARGAYGVCAQTADGRVISLRRVTPTDHMLAPGGMLAASFASLPPAKAALAPLVLDILDPCVLVSLTQVMDKACDHA